MKVVPQSKIFIEKHCCQVCECGWEYKLCFQIEFNAFVYSFTQKNHEKRDLIFDFPTFALKPIIRQICLFGVGNKFLIPQMVCFFLLVAVKIHKLF